MPQPGYQGPPPGYQTPYASSTGYQGPGYQPTAAWPPGPPPRPSQPGLAARMAAAPPQLLASLAISAGVVLLFVSSLFSAVGLETGTSGRARFLEFVAPADLAGAVALVLAVALSASYRSEATEAAASGSRPTAPALRAASFVLAAGIVGAAVTVAALVRGIVDLTIPHQSAAARIGNLLHALAAALVAAAATLWGLRKSQRK